MYQAVHDAQRSTHATASGSNAIKTEALHGRTKTRSRLQLSCGCMGIRPGELGVTVGLLSNAGHRKHGASHTVVAVCFLVHAGGGKHVWRQCLVGIFAAPFSNPSCEQVACARFQVFHVLPQPFRATVSHHYHQALALRCSANLRLHGCQKLDAVLQACTTIVV